MGQIMEQCLEAARVHGDLPGNDAEIGDLQALLETAWTLFTQDQKGKFSEMTEVRDILEWVEEEKPDVE